MACAQAMTFIVADDHILVRDGLKLMVSHMWPEVKFLEAHDGDSLMAVAHSAPWASLALVDLNMPDMNRGARLIELATSLPRLPLIAISGLASPDVVRRTLGIPSVHAFVSKSASADQMRLAINAALQGIKFRFNQPLPSLETEPSLTPRLAEVRSLLKQGMSNKRIAVALSLSEGTVKNYMSEIFRVLNVSNRTQAAQYDPDTS